MDVGLHEGTVPGGSPAELGGRRGVHRPFCAIGATLRRGGGGDVKVVCCLFLNTGSPRRWCCSGRALPPSATAQQLHRDGKTGTGEHTEFEDGGKF